MSVEDRSVLGPDRIKHLEFIQAVISRLGTSSFLIKGWVLTIAAAIFAVLANRLDAGIAVAALVPLVAFWLLDGYFLRQERLFRRLYDDVRKPDSTVELMSMNTAPYVATTPWRAAAFSATLMLFYGALIVIDLVLIGVATSR
jgi:hypothetical protein